MSKGTALITGASSGIGEALAREFARNDYDLIITARSQAKLESLAAELGDFVEVDVVDSDLCQ
ncbi:MAG: SDR family NAD(P)-dependent oxidoreductase, partial [Pseudomonadales bacterium]|nr:SDR family NAD(P)-dependent oxidoreductase [Pseudomonadales bacterium]